MHIPSTRFTGRNAQRIAVSVTSIFGEPDDLEAAARKDGVRHLLVTRGGRFRARLTQVTLHRSRLIAVDEELPRIAFVTVPRDMVLVGFPVGEDSSLTWGGMELRARQIVTLISGQQVQTMTDGPCHWGVMHVSSKDLNEYGCALSNGKFEIPTAAWWLPSTAAARQFRHFFRAAIRFAHGRPKTLMDAEAAHGLEQQLLDALVECLQTKAMVVETTTACRSRGVLSRFEKLFQTRPLAPITEICAALGISKRVLQTSCTRHLGMALSDYTRLRRMQFAHRILRGEDPNASIVSEVAQRYGFNDLERFVREYRSLYGDPRSHLG